ncbi:Lacal_2735 family protein [uncultured Algibacter sp.]|uniref:Lacal_2735 family protein n=1 Tax=uncultured Algibacter sp. TaxID=298659 RepID=UPI00263818AE|nr:Lacal_2735 family protein [uncultured Algibacter sp.]
MLGLFKRKSKLEKLEEKFKKLMREWHALSSVNRAASDSKYAEAQNIAKLISKLKHEEAA